MAFSSNTTNPVVDGSNLKVVTILATSADAHNTSRAFTFQGGGASNGCGCQSNLREVPVDGNVEVVTGRDNEVTQAFAISAFSTNPAGECTGFTIEKHTPAVGGGGAITLRCSFRLPRGIGR